jgi:hypothetical protein
VQQPLFDTPGSIRKSYRAPELAAAARRGLAMGA